MYFLSRLHPNPFLRKDCVVILKIMSQYLLCLRLPPPSVTLSQPCYPPAAGFQGGLQTPASSSLTPSSSPNQGSLITCTRLCFKGPRPKTSINVQTLIPYITTPPQSKLFHCILYNPWADINKICVLHLFFK